MDIFEHLFGEAYVEKYSDFMKILFLIAKGKFSILPSPFESPILGDKEMDDHIKKCYHDLFLTNRKTNHDKEIENAKSIIRYYHGDKADIMIESMYNNEDI
jgi:hypothetical protein